MLDHFLLRSITTSLCSGFAKCATKAIYRRIAENWQDIVVRVSLVWGSSTDVLVMCQYCQFADIWGLSLITDAKCRRMHPSASLVRLMRTLTCIPGCFENIDQSNLCNNLGSRLIRISYLPQLDVILWNVASRACLM